MTTINNSKSSNENQPLTAEGRAEGLTVEHWKNTIYIKHDIRILFSVTRLEFDPEPRLYFPHWEGPVSLDDAKLYHAALTEALVQAATLTTPPEPDYDADYDAYVNAKEREHLTSVAYGSDDDSVPPDDDLLIHEYSGDNDDDPRATPPEPPAAERDQYRVEKRHYNPQIPTEIIAEYEMLQAAALYVNSLPLAMPYYYVVVDQKTGLSAYHRCPHGDDPKPTNHQIATDSSAPVKLSKAQRELLEKLDRGVDIRGYHYDNPRDMTFRLQSAKPINLKTVRILESAGLITIKRDSRDDVLEITEPGRAALKGAK